MPDTFAGVWRLARIDRASPGITDMKTYEFDVILNGPAEVTDEQADALFAAGCDDATPVSSGGVTWIHFDREAPSLEEAIRSAIAQVQATGFRVSKVELDIPSAVFQGD